VTAVRPQYRIGREIEHARAARAGVSTVGSRLKAGVPWPPLLNNSYWAASAMGSRPGAMRPVNRAGAFLQRMELRAVSVPQQPLESGLAVEPGASDRLQGLLDRHQGLLGDDPLL
jgi:hypothetical protein